MGWMSTAVIVVLSAVTVAVVLDFASVWGAFSNHHKHYPGECKQVEGVQFGAEDFATTSTGLVFITSGYGFSGLSTSQLHYREINKVQGTIFLFDFNKPDAGVKALKIRPSTNFNLTTFQPHGIGLLEDQVKGEHRLYVVNHPRGRQEDAVEKFHYLPKTQELIHEKSFMDSQFKVLNDVAVMAEDEFYVTNYFQNSPSSYVLFLLEAFLRLPITNVIYVGKNNIKEVASNLVTPNGITSSRDGRYLYVAVSVSKTIEVYRREANQSLTLIQRIYVHTMPDNFQLSPDGEALYVGCHPKMYELLKHMEDPANAKAPSQILRLPLKDGKITEADITELFYDHGHLLSGSSVAQVFGKKLLIGTVFDKLAICDVAIPL